MFERVHYLHHIQRRGQTESAPTIYGGSYVCIYVTMWFRGVAFMEECLKLDSGGGRGMVTESHHEEKLDSMTHLSWQLKKKKKNSVKGCRCSLSYIACPKHQVRIYMFNPTSPSTTWSALRAPVWKYSLKIPSMDAVLPLLQARFILNELFPQREYCYHTDPTVLKGKNK